MKPDSSVSQDDTKFYIKFKDPRSKSQIFYYFHDEDIFDPCIPLNQGDVVADSSAVNLSTQQPPKPMPANPPIMPPSKTTISTKKNTSLPYFEDSTLQVQTANIIPNKKDKFSNKKTPDLDDSFEDVGYMTAMDIQYTPDEFEIPEEKKEEEEEVFQVLEEIVEAKPKNDEKKMKLTQMRTALEAVEGEEALTPIKISKEEFDKKSGAKECPEYNAWIDTHISKNSLNARAISPAEFRLLKKLIGLKK